MTVLELFKRVLHRMPNQKPTISFVDAAQSVQTIISRKLWEVRSDLLRDIWQSEEQDANVTVIDLPRNMLGVGSDRPYITYTSEDGEPQYAVLRPMTRERSQFVVSAGVATPSDYDIRGTIIEIFPTPNFKYKVNVPMFKSPEPLAEMGDTLPWNGFFDYLFQDAILHMAGPSGVAAFVQPQLERAILKAAETGSSLRTGRKVEYLFV